MKNIRWSDNISTVGWTCIHGTFSPQELRDLKTQLPKHRFSYTRLGFNETHGYVDFPEDEDGIAFLVNLKLQFPNLERGK